MLASTARTVSAREDVLIDTGPFATQRHLFRRDLSDRAERRRVNRLGTPMEMVGCIQRMAMNDWAAPFAVSFKVFHDVEHHVPWFVAAGEPNMRPLE